MDKQIRKSRFKLNTLGKAWGLESEQQLGCISGASGKKSPNRAEYCIRVKRYGPWRTDEQITVESTGVQYIPMKCSPADHTAEDALYMRSEAGGVSPVHCVNVLRAGGCTNCASHRMFSSFVCAMWRRGGERSGFCCLSACYRHAGNQSSALGLQVWALRVKMISLIEFIAECRLISISGQHTPTHTYAHTYVLRCASPSQEKSHCSVAFLQQSS